MPAEDELEGVKDTGNGSGSLPPRRLTLFPSISKALAEPVVKESTTSLPSSDPDS